MIAKNSKRFCMRESFFVAKETTCFRHFTCIRIQWTPVYFHWLACLFFSYFKWSDRLLHGVFFCSFFSVRFFHYSFGMHLHRFKLLLLLSYSEIAFVFECGVLKVMHFKYVEWLCVAAQVIPAKFQMASEHKPRPYGVGTKSKPYKRWRRQHNSSENPLDKKRTIINNA